MRLFPALLLATLSCILVTHGAGPPSPRTSSAPAQRAESQKAAAKPPVKTVTTGDSEFERNIRARFARSKISVNGFTVRVENGVAILEGKTGVIQHKGTVTRLARLAGVRRVDNRIEISDAARQKAAANFAAGKRVRVQTSGD